MRTNSLNEVKVSEIALFRSLRKYLLYQLETRLSGNVIYWLQITVSKNLFH